MPVVLNIGYAEEGPANGPVVILLHGWPYDIYSFANVTPILAVKGYRVIVPYLYVAMAVPVFFHPKQNETDSNRWLRLM